MIDTSSKKFAECDNFECKKMFTVSDDDIKNSHGYLLCPECRSRMSTDHLIQCKNCLSIIRFIEPDIEEIPTHFNVEKCTHCSGTRDDEKHIFPNDFPKLYI